MSYFFTLILLFYAPLANADGIDENDWPYQNCNKKNVKYTQSIIDELSNDNTEASAPCFECIYNDYLKERQKEVKELKKPFMPMISKECFLAMATRGNQVFEDEQYKHCPNKESKNEPSIKKLCANKKYIDMIQKSFNDMSHCFNLNSDKQGEVLALINQESGGILNIRSDSGARCLGQVTEDYVKTLNNIIQSGKSNIYNKTLERCPEVENFQISNKTIEQDEHHLICRVTRDPHSCLFYTFFGLERSHQQIKEGLNSHSRYMGNRELTDENKNTEVTDEDEIKEFTDEDKKRFPIPIKTNEMLTFNIKFKDSNQVATYTFWDDSELYDTMKKIREKQRVIEDITEIRKTPLFKENKKMETMFYYWSHNGGAHYAQKGLLEMVERLKKSIAQSCKPTDQLERCKLRKQIQNGKGLSAQQVLPIFEKDLKKTYPSKKMSRRNEVAEYVKNIEKNRQSTFGYIAKTKETNMMLNHYIESFKFKDTKKLSKEQATNFQEQVAEKCQAVKL